jgi:phosphoglycolate phosphatase-like HAD superfamily hydrolase
LGVFVIFMARSAIKITKTPKITPGLSSYNLGFNSELDMKSYSWLEVLNPQVVTGKTRCALFDFDGTISVIRRGWDEIMRLLMIEMIGDGEPVRAEIESEVTDFVNHSTGMATMKQMEWLENAVRQYGISRRPLEAPDYKQIFNERLLQAVHQRLGALNEHPESWDTLMIAGVRVFLEGLAERGVQLFLASGSDHEDVLAESALLHVRDFFEDRIYGAKNGAGAISKDTIIHRILKENHLRSDELLVVGDGPVEIRLAHQVGAVGLGVAADENTRQTFDPIKRARLIAAGADLLVPHFLATAELVELFCG